MDQHQQQDQKAPSANERPIRLMVVAGEASGDAHAAALVKALRETNPEAQFEFFGATGARMRATGVESICESDKLAILGLWEIATALPLFWRALRELKHAAIERRPDAAILIDWPDFNLRLARWLHRRGIRVIYYVSPQLWAWRSYRARNVRRDVDLLLSILPFEKDWYAARGITHIEYVGHPLAGEVRAPDSREEFCRRHALNSTQPIVALLPGSRHKELARILPAMLDAAAIISDERPDVQFVVVVAPNRDPKEARDILDAHKTNSPPAESLHIIHHETRAALAAADAAAVCSGTATLEAALLGTPMTIVYKESTINWHVLGSLINVEHYGLVNLIAGKRVATELIQNDLNGGRLARELLNLLEPARNQEVRHDLKQVAALLGEGGASRRAAEAILGFLNS